MLVQDGFLYFIVTRQKLAVHVGADDTIYCNQVGIST
jgi:hypothetical protein